MHPVHFLLPSVPCHPVPIRLLFSCRLTASPRRSFHEHHPLLPSSQPPCQCRSRRKQPFPHTTRTSSAVSCFLLNLCLLFSPLHNSVLPPNQAFAHSSPKCPICPSQAIVLSGTLQIYLASHPHSRCPRSLEFSPPKFHSGFSSVELLWQLRRPQTFFASKLRQRPRVLHGIVSSLFHVCTGHFSN